MSTVWIVAVLMAAGPQATIVPAEGSPEQSTVQIQQPLVPLRTGVELRDAVRDALRRWARVEDKQAQQAAREFLVLYKELDADTKMAATQREHYRGKVRGRLAALSTQITKRAAIERRLAKKRRPESVDTAAKDSPAMGQMFGGGMGGGGGMMGGGMRGGGMGGGGMGMGGGGGGVLGGQADAGPELVDLIQTTIAPRTWEINGGPGSIRYWRSQRALIIRQTGEVHGFIGDLMGQMGN